MAIPFHFGRKRQTAVKGRSSALIVSIIIHLVIFLVAGTFVAVTVVKKEEPKFEGKQIARPKMKLKKLQVPVKIEKKMKRQAPKLSQRVTAVKVNTKSVDFKMPEISGLGGGLGVNLSESGLGGSLGFASTQINVFGLKSSGEKIIFILDTTQDMLVDELGGIPAYKIIKNELTSIIGNLPPTTLFNVILFDLYGARAFSKDLSLATDANIQKLKDWLAPLNTQKNRVGFSTLASPGTPLSFEPMVPIPNTQVGWLAGLTYAIKKNADVVYWLGAQDYLRPIIKSLYLDCKNGKPLTEPSGVPKEYLDYDWKAYGGKEKWNKIVAEARELYKEENEKRRKAGQPMRVIPGYGSDRNLVYMYFPSKPLPEALGRSLRYYYEPSDILEYIEAMQKKYRQQDRRAASIGLNKQKFSFNVIHFVPVNKDVRPLARLETLPDKLHGEYLQIQGLKAIESAATAGK